MNTQLFAFFSNCLLAPAELLSDLVTVDAYWHWLNLLVYSRLTRKETQTKIWNWLRQRPHHTQVVHFLQTVHCLLHLMCQWWQNSCILSSSLMTTPCTRNATYDISRNHAVTQSEQHWHSNADIEDLQQTQNYQLMQLNAHLGQVCPKDGCKRYVLFFKITSEINM